MQVAKWGNSLAVRLPATVVEALGIALRGAAHTSQSVRPP